MRTRILTASRILSLAALAFLPALAARADTAALPGFKEVARKVRPAVVNLSVVKNVKAGGMGMDPFMDQFFGRFFQQPDQGREQTFKQRSLGSGVIVDAQAGYVLTNNHVVEDADAITVKLADKRELPGTVVGRDPKTDLAVVRIKDASGLTAAPFGDSDQIDVGDWVLAVGSPFGLEQTVSHGIISAKGRVIGDGPYDDFLQTDAPINPGNSGGPLVDLAGEVVGINTAISTRSGGSEGIGFAIPSNMAKSIYHELVSSGKVVRGWLGISIQDLDPALAVHFGLPKDSKGVLVADVMDQGPAKAAGLRSGDVIQSFAGKSVDSVRELQRLVAETPVGKESDLAVWRGDGLKNLTVKIGNMDQGDDAESQGDSEASPAPKLGLDVRPLTPDEAQQRHVEGGAYVEQVAPGSPAEEAGIQPGDLILELGHNSVHGPQDLARYAKRLKAGSTLVLRVQRDGRSLYLTLQIPDSDK
jgi:serine protease Do